MPHTDLYIRHFPELRLTFAFTINPEELSARVAYAKANPKDVWTRKAGRELAIKRLTCTRSFGQCRFESVVAPAHEVNHNQELWDAMLLALIPPKR